MLGVACGRRRLKRMSPPFAAAGLQASNYRMRRAPAAACPKLATPGTLSEQAERDSISSIEAPARLPLVERLDETCVTNSGLSIAGCLNALGRKGQRRPWSHQLPAGQQTLLCSGRPLDCYLKGLWRTKAYSNVGFRDQGCVEHTAIQAQCWSGPLSMQTDRFIVYVDNRIRISDQVAPGFQGNQNCCKLDFVNGVLGLYSEAGQNAMLERALRRSAKPCLHYHRVCHRCTLGHWSPARTNHP